MIEYRGIAEDQLGRMAELKTRWYVTWEQAQHAIEKLCRRKYGEDIRNRFSYRVIPRGEMRN